MAGKNRRGVCSEVAQLGGVPTLFVNGAPFPAAAYMTYLTDRGDFAAFAAAGYRLFSVPVLFAGRWINAAVENPPFHGGIFDRKGSPDYSALDACVRRVLAACPDAYVFPRLNLSMPLWWIAENPDCTDGTGKRELLFSARYRETAADMLRTVIRHIEESDYVAHIAGYQLAGGNTEEWFHFDLNGGYCKNAEPAFEAFLEKEYPGCGFTGLPELSALKGDGVYHHDERLARYLEFSNRSVASLICDLCGVAKAETGGALAVGTFYGYSLEVSSPLWGTHALRALLQCPDVDFVCSPNSYIGSRSPDLDWTEMYPAASVRLHGKLCMQECDVRTHLTRPLCETAPAFDPARRYTAPVWQGLESRAASVNALRKTFCRQLIAGNGFWWFDMWGGWYHDPTLLTLLEEMRRVYVSSLSAKARKSVAQLAVFVDESAYGQMTDCAFRGAAFGQRVPLGTCGAPYDLYDVSDFEAVFRGYTAVLFLNDLQTGAVRRAAALCGRSGVPYLALSEEKPQVSSRELRALCRDAGAHIYCETDDLLYVNGSFLALHATSAGVKTVHFPAWTAYRELLTENGVAGEGACLRISMAAGETRLFALGADAAQ